MFSVKIEVEMNMEKKRKWGCGHTSPRKIEGVVLGKTILLQYVGENMEHCPQCLAKMAIPCGICGKPILPYKAVCSAPSKESDGSPRRIFIGTIFRPSGWIVICTRHSDFGAIDAIGTWKPPGIVDEDDLPIARATRHRRESE